MRWLHFDAIEKNYIRNYIGANRRLWILGCILVFIFMSDRFFPSGILNHFINIGSNGLQYSRGYENEAAQLFNILSFFIFVIGFFLAMYQYRFLNKRSSCDLYLSLPIKRERFFLLHYLIGVVVLVVTTFGVYLLCLLIGFASVSFAQAMIFGVIAEVLGVACFSFFTWIHIKCNSLLDAIVVCSLYFILPLLLHAGLRVFMLRVEEGIYIADAFSSFYDTDIALLITNFLSPVWLMRSIAMMFTTYDFTTFMCCGVLASIIFWMLMSFLFYVKGIRAFSQKHSENIGHRTTSLVTYPILIPFFILVLLLFFVSSRFSIITTSILFVVYLLLTFFAQRRMKFHRSMLLIYALLVVGVRGCYTLMIETAVFGLVHEIPQESSISDVMLQITKIEHLAEENTNYGYEEKTYISRKQASKETLLEVQNRIMEISVREMKPSHSYLNDDYRILFEYTTKKTDMWGYYRSYNIEIQQEAEMEALIDELLEDEIIEIFQAQDAQEEEV